MVQDKRLSKARASSVTHPLQHFFLERIISDALEDYNGKVNLGGRNIINLRFADDINAIAGQE